MIVIGSKILLLVMASVRSGAGRVALLLDWIMTLTWRCFASVRTVASFLIHSSSPETVWGIVMVILCAAFVKSAKKASELTEDDLKNLEEKIQKITDKFIKEVDAVCEKKTKEVMEL